MLANLKIIWQFHAHPVHQKVSRFFEPRYIGDNFYKFENILPGMRRKVNISTLMVFRNQKERQNLVSFNRTVVPYEISKVNFRVEAKILVSMSEEI